MRSLYSCVLVYSWCVLLHSCVTVVICRSAFGKDIGGEFAERKYKYIFMLIAFYT